MSLRLENGVGKASRAEPDHQSATVSSPAPDVSPGKPDNKSGNGCPYLGIVDDSDTRYLFPSPIGMCYRANPEALVCLEQQQAFCLVEQYVNCPVFQRAEIGPLPEALSADPPGRRYPAWAGAVGGVALALLAMAFFFGFFRPGATVAPPEEAAPLAAALPTETPTPTATLTAVPTATPQPSPTNSPTETAMATAVASPTTPPTATPTATFAPSPTATPAVIALINVQRLNVRQGPGQTYDVIGVMENGDTLTVIGQSADSVGWWQVCCVAGEPGWVFGESILIEGDTGNLPIASPPP